MNERDVVHRLERLERENRRLKRAGAALGVLLVGLLAAGWARPQAKEVVAESFVLKNPDGETLGMLTLDDEGYPHFEMRHERSRALITLAQPGLLLRDDTGKRGAFLGVDTRGDSRLELTGKQLVDGIRLAVQEDSTAGIHCLNRLGRKRASMEFLADGNAQFTTRDSEGEVRGFFGLDSNEISSLVLLDSRGGRRVGMLVEPRGDLESPTFALQGSDGKIRSELTLDRDDTPLLRLYRLDGKPSFTAP